MKITFVLPTLSLTGGIRVVSIFAERLRKRGHSVFVIMATWWETAEWVAKLSPSKGTKVYFLEHYEAFDYAPKGRVESTWWLSMHQITVALWLAD